jgi:autotransporter-associated beta strand protein
VTTAAAGTLTTDLAGGETFAKNVTDTGHFVATGTTNNYAISGIVCGTGNFTKTGANNVTVTGANTYKGGTAVSGGTLLIDNTSGSGTGTGAVTVNNGGTLGGTGTITGAMTLNYGGTVEPGAGSIGTAGTTLHATSMLWNSGGTLTLQLGPTGDELVLTGALTKSATGTFTLNLLDAGITQTTYTLATFSSSTFAASNFTLELPTGDTGNLVKTATSLMLTMVSVEERAAGTSPTTPLLGLSSDLSASSSSPSSSNSDTTGTSVVPTPEPGSATLLTAGAGCVLGWRRRRRG